MKARFKGRKSKWYYLGRIGLIIFIIVISFLITFKILYDKIKVKIADNSYVDYLINDAFSTYNLEDITSMSSTEFLLKYSFGIEHFNTGLNKDFTTLVINTVDEEPPVEIKEVEEVQEIDEKPIVYIFNTHETEAYKSDYAETFNITNTVGIASHILAENLEKLGIKCIVEENSITDILNINGWKYNSSYKASRILLEEAYKNNSSLTFFIDIHRDSSSYNYTTAEIDDKKYAKILFVVGLEHDKYKDNLEVANILNEKLLAFNKNITRGVLKKEGPGVNGIYNQDFNKNTILIEVGGQYNTIEEVNNTLKIMASVLFNYLKEQV